MALQRTTVTEDMVFTWLMELLCDVYVEWPNIQGHLQEELLPASVHGQTFCNGKNKRCNAVLHQVQALPTAMQHAYERVHTVQTTVGCWGGPSTV